MARRDKYGILPPPPVARGTVVRLRQGRNGELTNRRGIVMGKVKPDNYSRAYGPEVYVCTISGDAVRASRVASKALKSGKRKIAKAIVEKHTDVSEKNTTMVVPVGRVKKIPKICQLAMKVEKGKL
jgi:hypothetical protein